MFNPKISIVVPVYNVEKYLHRCIASVLSQTFIDFELLLIDDGSIDASGKICDEYAQKDKRIRVFHKKNGGVSSARNMGIEHVRGEWITFADSDDYFMPDALETYYKTIEHYQPDMIKAGYKIEYVSGKTQIISDDTAMVTKHEQMLLRMEQSYYLGFLWNTCMRTEISKRYKLDETISYCEDHLYVYNCMLSCEKLIILSDAVYVYGKNDIVVEGHGDTLSTCRKDFHDILYVAEITKNLKLKFYKSDADLYAIIHKEYVGRLTDALYCSFFEGTIKFPLFVTTKYLNGNYKIFIKQWLRFIKGQYLRG